MQSSVRHAVIMAGGRGTRLAPYSTILPKPLMPIGDVPILEIVLRQLKHFHFTDITLCVGHLAELIQAVVGGGERWGTAVRYYREDVPLGTMGALRKIALPSKPFIVMNGDVLTDLDYDALFRVHCESRAAMTIAAVKRHVDVSLGVLEYSQDNNLSGFKEKPRFSFDASMGVYVLSPEIVDRVIPDNRPFGFDDLVLALLSSGRPIRVFPTDGLWLDIGRREDYEVAVEVFHQHRSRFLRDESGTSVEVAQ